MKKLLFYIMVLMLTIISSCSKDNSSSSVKDDVVNTASSGTWKITYFFDTDKEETSNFSGYNFTFGSNNVLSASSVTNNYTGTWSIMNNNSNDDTLSDLDFTISFASPELFNDLNEAWEILSKTESKIELRHVSGGNGGTDLLTFGKN
jgi:hypothetical protein